MNKQLKIFYSLLLAIMLIGNEAWANTRFSLSGGGYSVTGTGGAKPVSVSGLGSYRFSFLQELSKGIHLNAGYNIIYESIFAGDSIYGIDVGISWFFLEPSLVEVFRTDSVVLRITRKWSPYAGVQFNQRQFQSNKSNYAGMGLHGGAHFPIVDNFSWHSEVRYNTLSGPNKSSATELSLLLGVSSEF